jgi:hypothetical protein
VPALRAGVERVVDCDDLSDAGIAALAAQIAAL